jgi:SNF2 family DNA or RNA helicase
LATYNRERFEDLVSASWDLVIVDESHRLGGSTEQVARYKLGAALAEAAPYLLLLSATPHQGKTDHFLRLIQLLDRESFPDEGSVTRERVRPFVIRTEKREAIDAEGQPLFKPRMTRLQAVTWQPRHQAQRRLYEAVTDYVRHGYNQAMAAQQRHIGFLMILMQRLVTSSTAAIRTTLERRLAVLDAPQTQASLFDGLAASDAWTEWAELDGQAQADMVVQTAAETLDGLAREKSEVAMLLSLARETEAAGTDAKAESLLELIYRLQQEEADPTLKVLVFTEFVPTQRMLADYLEERGFSVALLNGAMDLDARTGAQQAFSQDAQILISTDAGGEGLNLQFCHVVVNFDMPWNPMRVEQRIGRVDRIGQRHVVRAINFVLEETVEYRVRQVLEEKLTIIAKEFGVDKAADVMDSVEAEPWFDELFVHGLTDPASIDRECDAVLSQIREKVAESRKDSELLAGGPSETQKLAQDGVRVRASAGAASFRRGETLEACLEEARTQVEALKRQVEDDPSAVSRRRQAARERAARERQERLERALARLPEMAEIKGQTRQAAGAGARLQHRSRGHRHEDGRRWIPARLQRPVHRRHRFPGHRRSRGRHRRDRQRATDPHARAGRRALRQAPRGVASRWRLCHP